MQHKRLLSKALNFFEKPFSVFIVAVCVLSFAPARLAFSQTSTANGAAASVESELTRLVDPFVGTDNDGNTFPGATVPFGMVQWSPDTTKDGFYRYRTSTIRGFSLTHLSGAGCPAYADIPFLPITVPVKASPATNPDDYVVSFSHRHEEAAPGYYRVALDTGAEVKLSATSRTGFALITYPAGREA